MSMIPQWYTRLPSPFSKKKGESGNWLENLEEEMSALASYPSGLSISSDDKNIYIAADVPGLTSKDVEVTVDNTNVLWIKGERKVTEEDKEKKFYRQSQQIFSYCIPLGDEVDSSTEPNATVKNGVMRITFKKKKDKLKETKKISVKEEK